jgi:hypothetical protein
MNLALFPGNMRFLAAGLITALSISSAIAAARFDTNAELVVISNRFDSDPMTAEGSRSDCKTSVPFARTAEEILPKAFENVFLSVRLVPAGAASGDDLTISFEVVRAVDNYLGDRNKRFEIEYELVTTARDAPPLRKRFSATAQVSGPMLFGGTCESIYGNAVDLIQRSLVESIQKAVTALSQDADFAGTVESSIGDRVRDAELMASLQALLATYRVTESEAVVRKRPGIRGSVVRKLGMGSIVQIIGKLPTGWLQVAKEGEVIGWIHEGSVTAMSVQTPAAPPAIPAKPAAVSPAPTFAAPAADTFPTKPVAVSFPRGKPAPDDIAVIIGNANYKATAKDIPDVVPAYADAEGMKRYATQALGIKEENVIFIKDARLADLIATFGNESNPKGKLWNWVKANRSQVFIFYSGHGAPSGDGASSYLVPVDATASLIDLSGYSLKTLYTNLGKLPAKSVTVVLEACFSGASQNGMLVKNASPIYQKALTEIVPPNLTVISAGSGNQIASWEQDKSHGLFTKHYLLGMAGAADRKPYGNGDGKVSTEELQAYLKGTMSYMAQRYYGREQTVQVATGAGR